MKQGYFVTGTDTGIGKTVVSAILAVGLDANYWKPLQTGTEEGSDSAFVRTWIGAERVQSEAYVFSESLSPHLAAKRSHIEIGLEKCTSMFRSMPKPVIVEGAGGVLVPLNSQCLIADLIGLLGLPAIVVARTQLGTINHTLLTLEALRIRKLPIAGVVTVGDENKDAQDSIRFYGQTEMIGHVSFCPSFHRTWFQNAYQYFSFPECSQVRSLCQTI